MDSNEKRILQIIRFTPIFVISMAYITISLFMYVNSYELFEKYLSFFLILSIIIIRSLLIYMRNIMKSI
jgi:hypothetical protein